MTSVQAIKETHELCKRVVHCLRARKIHFTTKDVFLHPTYGEELNERMGGFSKNVKLPQVSSNAYNSGKFSIYIVCVCMYYMCSIITNHKIHLHSCLSMERMSGMVKW